MTNLTLPEAMKIVSDNAHGTRHNYWLEYLPAVLKVNAAFPITGYVTVEDTAAEVDRARADGERLSEESYGQSWDESYN